ncbi:hypothetical protein HDV00_000281 [Rhizophlyctis rosea]|nr:hypothetical protein HDV00_000281 [Rhizophlyctis rosea]
MSTLQPPKINTTRPLSTSPSASPSRRPSTTNLLSPTPTGSHHVRLASTSSLKAPLQPTPNRPSSSNPIRRPSFRRQSLFPIDGITRSEVDLAFELLCKNGRKVTREDVREFLERVAGGLWLGNAGGSMSERAFAAAQGGSKPNVNASPQPPATPGPDRSGHSSARGARGGGGDKEVEEEIWRLGLDKEHAKLVKNVIVGKEELSREGLMNLLVHRTLSFMPFDEAMQWFEPHSDSPFPGLTEADLRKVAMLLHPWGVVEKGDTKALLAAFDRDGDGVIGLDDFKRMSLDSFY